ncbi:hypothetical protein BDQ12DRAFT_681886 [Crucibulum laeve]|uniref:Uncharacterized protein n=1 Tax=Crucibulum laeve TaxID=68775 RepID=A0A5C3M4H4_9AGAR|nr:hypothetical protein BDQ12DRAFT_681886 [Crucibulum laeve]
MPILGGVQDFLAGTGIDPGGGGGAQPPPSNPHAHPSAKPGYDLDGIDYGAHFSLTGNGGGGRDDEDDRDGDYIDHLQQPGNTKKRKVPANASSSPRGGHDVGGTGEQDEPTDRGIPTGRVESDAPEPYNPPPTNLGLLGQKRGKLTAATLAGLQHKEMLKSRKRQLAAVLGALSHGDTLALDQALSANYPFASGSMGFDDLKNMEPPRIRLSKRDLVRLARVARLTRVPRHPDAVPLPMGDFTFVCPSATADRLIATKEEVAMLRNRFEAELERQAAKAAKLAAANKLMSLPGGKGGKTKRSERAQQRARTITSGKGGGGEQTAEFLDQQTTGPTKQRGGKKKKRSALANASNPHHLRNYVPSRLPHTGSNPQANATAQNTLWPLPLRFLSAEIPPRRRKKSQAAQPTSQLTNPSEEWICAFCEYDLFYGDEQEYRRAVRNRKKILRRRRRARERAAAAASGSSKLKVPEKTVNEEYDLPFEPSPVDELSNLPKQTKWKGDPNKDRERAQGGEQASYG